MTSYIKLATDDSVVASETVTRPLFTTGSADAGTIVRFYASGSAGNVFSSTHTIEDEKNTSVYAHPNDIYVGYNQFSMQYGNISGSYSRVSTPQGVGYSQIVYNSIRNLIYGDESVNVSFSGISQVSNIYVLSFARRQYKETLLPSSFNLSIVNGGVTMNLTDNSKDLNTNKFINSRRYFDLVSGSNGSLGSGQAISNTVSGSYGYVFPDLGMVVINGDSLALSTANKGLGIVPQIGNINNAGRLVSYFTSLSARSQETIHSKFVYVRVKNGDLNYTTNPSIIDSTGSFIYPDLISNPQTYITTVGLLNDDGDLLAVAKISKPIVKDFTKEALIQVKLDY